MSENLGRGSYWICFVCGGFYDWMSGRNDLCGDCNQKRILPIMARKVAEKRANGIPIKSWQKRGQKAYISRLANLFFQDYVNDMSEFLKSIERLEKRDGNRKRVRQVKRAIIQKTKSF